jgi:hypothetical protein
VRAFVPSLELACVGLIKWKIGGVVERFTGRRLAILRVKFS